MELFWSFIGAGIVACAYVAGRIAGRRAVRPDRKATHERFLDDRR